MKQKIISLVAALAMPFIAHAQTNVSIYGFIDAAVAAERGGAAGSVTKLASGVVGSNRLGFRGSEDLGSGYKAIFNMETGFAIDTGATVTPTFWGRQTFVGLSSPYGTVTLGNQFTSLFTTLLLVGDPMKNGYAGQAANLMTSGVVGGPRAAGGLGLFRSNTIMYKSPDMNGFSGDAAYSLGEAAGDSSRSRSYGISGGYVNGPLTVRLAHLNTNNATATDSSRNSLLAANYDFGVARAYVALGRNKGFGAVDNREWLVGISVPFGVSRVLASYIRKDDKAATANDASQLALAYVYSLSKRTDLYVSAARISQDVPNTSASFYSINSGAPGVPGGGDKAFNFGVSHAF